MAHKAKDNKAHGSSLSKHTSTKTYKRPSKERGPYGENNGTVQPKHVKKAVKTNKKTAP